MSCRFFKSSSALRVINIFVPLFFYSGITISSSKSSSSSDSGSKTRNFNGESDAALDVESVFFDLESAMEKHLICRDMICTDKEQEKLFLQSLVDVLLLLLLPPDDFHCLSFRMLLRDLLVGGVLLPLFSLITDPDYINLSIIWLVSRVKFCDTDRFAG